MPAPADRPETASPALRYGPDDRPPAPVLSLYGLQWVATSTYPVILGLGVVGLHLNLTAGDLSSFTSASLLTIGVASLVHALWGHRLAVLSGPSLLPGLAMVAAVGAGAPLPQVFGGVIVGSIVVAVLAPLGLVRVLRRVLTPLAVGVLVMLFGLVTAQMGMELAAHDGPLGFGLALVLGLSIGAISLYARPPVSSLGVLIAVVAGYSILAAIGLLDLGAVHSPQLIVAPRFYAPAWPAGAVLLTMIIAQLANAGVTAGNVQAAADLVGRRVTNSAARRTIMVNAGVEGVLPAMLGATPLVPYAVSLGVVSLTRVATRYAVALGGAVLIGLSFFGPGVALLAGVPRPVAGAVLLGIAAPQIGVAAQMWGAGTPSFNMRRLFIASAATFIALGETSLPADFYARVPSLLAQILRNPVVAGLIYVIILEQLVFRQPGRGEPSGAGRGSGGF